ncbi:MAG: metal ABC transporter ATP-binding protein [Actinomycetota bacterium]|nr:metal ABC transporter ATP-binding protein [Actinomycetota bacterium]MDP2287231.1 metal ABC transporter ATP-binding protein [Actinomycetota bacterium]
MTGIGEGPELIQLDGVDAGYSHHPVLSDVNFHVHEDQFTGIVGPSGAGKTTLLRLLLGTLKPMKGRITQANGLRMAYVPQLETVSWNFPVTVRECVLMSRKAANQLPWASKPEKSQVADVLERLGIGDLAERHIRELSGGQQQRMFLARALLRQPQIMLLDEPTSGVDVSTRHDVLHLLADLHEEGVAIVLTTHDLNGIAAHLPHLVCVNKGIIASGTPNDVMNPDVLERTFGARMEVLEHLGMRIVVEEGPHIGAIGGTV